MACRCGETLELDAATVDLCHAGKKPVFDCPKCARRHILSARLISAEISWIPRGPLGRPIKEPVFARTRWSYDSYRDYWTLVELAGFRTCYVDEMDLLADETYIVTPVNGELRPYVGRFRAVTGGRAAQKARLIWWNLERPDSGSDEGQFPGSLVSLVATEALDWFDFVWSSCRFMASQDPRIVHVVMGSDQRLARIGKQEAAYDIAHLSYLTSRRHAILGQLRHLRIAPNSWEPERSRILAGTRAMLNVHQTPAPIVEPLRFVLAAAFGMPLLSETCADPWPLEPGKEILMADHALLPGMVGSWLDDPSIADIGEALKKKLTEEWTFKDGVMDAVSRTRFQEIQK